MKRKLIAQRLILPILAVFLILAPLLGAAAVGEHRYEVRHPAYMRHLCNRMLGEERGSDDWSGIQEIPVGGDGGVTNILVLGRDREAGLTDVMILLSVDADAHSLRVLQLPRDTYANYTGDKYKKLNGAYRKLGGPGLTEFLSRNMGVSVDRYVCVDLAVFGEIVDILGGVPINIPADMDYDDPSQNLHIHLDAGEQTLDGKQAEMFVRFRAGYVQADVGRMDAQKLFLAALASHVKKTLTVGRAVDLACKCFGKVKTDLSLRECISLAGVLMKIDMDKIHMSTLQGESTRSAGSGAWYYILNREAAQKQLFDTFGEKVTFDPDRVFTDTARADYQGIYLASIGRYRVGSHTASEVLDGTLTPARLS